jgi:hypothetical protein
MMRVLDEHPDFAHKVAQFMALADAADVLDELKPLRHEFTAGHLRELAANVLMQTALGEDFIQAMIAARPKSTI